MATYPRSAWSWCALTLTVLLCLTSITSALAPRAALAGTDLQAGTGALVGPAAGALVRTDPSYDANVVHSLPQGTWVDLLDGPLWGGDGSAWYQVAVWGATGYIAADYLTNANGGGDMATDAAPAAAPATTDAAVGGFTAASTGSGVVTGTNGDGVNCRAEASYSAWVITILPEGTWVELTGGRIGEWQPVNCGGRTGYVYGAYISGGGSSGAPPASNPSDGGATDGGTDLSGASTLMVSGTNGDGVKCRSWASYDASVIVVLAEGTEVASRGWAEGVWQAVYCAGTNGYVHGSFLSSGGWTAPAPSTGNTGNTGTTPTWSNSSLVAGDHAMVTGTNGTGVKHRTGAGYDAAVISVIAEGQIVSVGSGSTGDWVAASYNGASGFIHYAYLTWSSGAPAAPSTPAPTTPAPSSGNSGGLAAGSHAVTTSSLNLRYDAYVGAGIAAVAPAGTVVAITGGASNGFYGVNWDGLYGYMHGDYLAWTDAALSERWDSGTTTPTTPAPAPTPTPTPAPGNGAGSGNGSAIANFALQYVGYPYVWAGEGPYAFDCSGFTMFVVRNVLGLNITHDMFVQYDMGAPVAWGSWQPGDLVFFQNTFRWGMSHVGIYIGNGQFVHAENESTGVRISDINSQYYSSRYYGAVRY